MKVCYVIGAGEFYGELSPTPSDLVIAADGGLDTLLSLGVRCDLLVGDMDSLKGTPTGIEAVKHPVEKDETDMHLAYLEGVKRGYKKFVLFGGVGGREDHTFANYSLLLYAKQHGHDMKLVSKSGTVFVIKDEEIKLAGKKGDTLSVFAFGSVCAGVSIRGAKYETDKITLSPDFPLGVSNEFACECVSISVESGNLLVMHSDFSR